MRISTRSLLFAAVLSGVMAVPAMAQTSVKSSAEVTAPAVKSAASNTPAPKKALTDQQKRMATCNADAKGKKGADRKAFMSSCLKGETASGKKLTSSQQRMKDCNAQAGTKSLAGDQRKAFMSTCLKAK